MAKASSSRAHCHPHLCPTPQGRKKGLHPCILPMMVEPSSLEQSPQRAKTLHSWPCLSRSITHRGRTQKHSLLGFCLLDLRWDCGFSFCTQPYWLCRACGVRRVESRQTWLPTQHCPCQLSTGTSIWEHARVEEPPHHIPNLKRLQFPPWK